MISFDVMKYDISYISSPAHSADHEFNTRFQGLHIKDVSIPNMSPATSLTLIPCSLNSLEMPRMILNAGVEAMCTSRNLGLSNLDKVRRGTTRSDDRSVSARSDLFSDIIVVTARIGIASSFPSPLPSSESEALIRL